MFYGNNSLSPMPGAQMYGMQSIPGFITGIDFGSRYVITVFNSALQSYHFTTGDIEKELRSLNKRISYTKKSIKSASRLISKAQTREDAMLAAQINNELKNNLSCLTYTRNATMRTNSQFLVRALFETLPYNSILAIEHQDCFDTYEESKVKFVREHDILAIYTMIRNTLPMKGIQLVLIDRENTSHKCPLCGTTTKDNRDKKKHMFECVNCGFLINDDSVAALNIMLKAETLVYGQRVTDVDKINIAGLQSLNYMMNTYAVSH